MNNVFSKIKLSLREFKIYQNAYYWLILPLVIVFIALVCGTVYSTEGNKYDGFANIGVDFKGGTVMTVEMIGADLIGNNYNVNESLIRDIIEDNGASIGTVQTSGSNAIVFRYPNSINGQNYNATSKTGEMIEINNKISTEIQRALVAKYGSAITVSADAEIISATASSELIQKAFLSVGIALLLILLYIIVRFDLFSGIAAILGLAHDVIIMFACVIIFNIQINSSLIACAITIVSYSINNTIIIFDRVRENIAPYKNKKQKIDIRWAVNESVKQTFTRSCFTTLTTLFTVGVLACVGVPALTEFALPIIFGLIAGLYSSVFISPSIWGLMMRRKLDGGKGKKPNNQSNVVPSKKMKPKKV